MTKKVLAFGTFDLFHPGHAFYLKQAKLRGDELHVIVARDSTVMHVKNRPTLNKEQSRLSAIRTLTYVTKAYLGNEGDKFALIEEIRPDVICLGYDQKTFGKNLKEILNDRGLDPIIEVIPSYRPEKFKSTKLRKRIT